MSTPTLAVHSIWDQIPTVHYGAHSNEYFYIASIGGLEVGEDTFR